MENLITILLFVLIVLVGALVWKLYGTGKGKERFEAILNERLIDFYDRIHQSIDGTRREIEQSKDVLSNNALKTLEHIQNMSGTIGNLVRQQEKAQELGKSLEYLLQTPKLRGNYGETILEEMLERILPRGMWERQYAIDGNEKVDAVVKYKDVVVPIDSKFPREDYQRYLAVKDPAEKKLHWANYEKALKIQINLISEKYIKPGKGTTEFALLFIPSESIYYETIAEKNYLGDPCQIYEYATKRKVIPVSPNTFYAFLHVIMLGVRNIEIAKDAKKLQELLFRLEKDFDLFYRRFEFIGKTIDSAQEAYRVGGGHIERFKRNLESVFTFDKKFQEEISEASLPAVDGKNPEPVIKLNENKANV